MFLCTYCILNKATFSVQTDTTRRAKKRRSQEKTGNIVSKLEFLNNFVKKVIYIIA